MIRLWYGGTVSSSLPLWFLPVSFSSAIIFFPSFFYILCDGSSLSIFDAAATVFLHDICAQQRFSALSCNIDYSGVRNTIFISNCGHTETQYGSNQYHPIGFIIIYSHVVWKVFVVDAGVCLHGYLNCCPGVHAWCVAESDVYVFKNKNQCSYPLGA